MFSFCYLYIIAIKLDGERERENACRIACNLAFATAIIRDDPASAICGEKSALTIDWDHISTHTQCFNGIQW